MKRTELAGMLNGLEAPVVGDICKRAARAGLVILCGPWASFEGAIEGTAHLCDDKGDSTGGVVYFDARGILPDYEEIDSENEVEARDYFDRKRLAVRVDVELEIVSEDRGIWRYRVPFPHSTFTLMSDGEPYSKGIVFHLADAGLRLDE